MLNLKWNAPNTSSEFLLNNEIQQIRSGHILKFLLYSTIVGRVIENEVSKF